MISDLELMSRFLQRCSYRLSRERKIDTDTDEFPGAAVMMGYDFWIYDLEMMTTNIPSTIYISLDTLSPTALTACYVRKTYSENVIGHSGGGRRRSITALRWMSHHILLQSTFFLTFTLSTFLQAGIATCESLRGFLIPCCGGLTQLLVVTKKKEDKWRRRSGIGKEAGGRKT